MSVPVALFVFSWWTLAACGESSPSVVDTNGPDASGNEQVDAGGGADSSSSDGASSTDAKGPLDSGSDAGPASCLANQRVSAKSCVACPPGTTNAAGDDPSGADTTCDATLCATDQRVQSHACVACDPGSNNVAGDDASGTDTTCDGALCPSNHHVVSNACVACPAGSTRPAGDTATGADTACTPTLCLANEHVTSNVCVACPAGSTNAAGNDATGADTSCTATLCAVDEHVASNACVACLPGSTNAAGDDATGADTGCDATLCTADQHVVSHACVACPPGSTHASGDDATGADTTCQATLCTANQRVVNHACVACPSNSVNDAGDDATGGDTTCDVVETSICGTANEWSTLSLQCYGGAVITGVSFASYGTPDGTCGAFTAGSCDATTSVANVQTACVQKASCSVSATNGVFGDPCVGTVKRLYVQAECKLCGNATVDPGEVCDDGVVNPVFCSSDCSTKPVVATLRFHCNSTSEVTDEIRGAECVNVRGDHQQSWLQLVPGVKATVYSAADCTGKSVTITAADTNFCATSFDQGGSLNDSVHSIRVERN